MNAAEGPVLGGSRRQHPHLYMFSWSFRTKHPGVSWVMLIYQRVPSLNIWDAIVSGTMLVSGSVHSFRFISNFDSPQFLQNLANVTFFRFSWPGVSSTVSHKFKTVFAGLGDLDRFAPGENLQKPMTSWHHGTHVRPFTTIFVTKP